MEQKKYKRLVADIPFDLHSEVKMQAAKEKISINRWLTKKIITALYQQKKTELETKMLKSGELNDE